MKTAEYMAALKKLAPRQSYYQVAQLLEVSENVVGHYVNGRRHPPLKTCVKIAELLQVEPMKVIADVEADREKDPVEKAKWKTLARKLSCWAPVFFAMTISLSSGSSEAAPVNRFTAVPNATLYELCAAWV